MKSGALLMAAALFALVAGAATAPAGDLYKWRDANGVLHFSDSPPAETGKQVETRKVEEGGGGDFDVMKNYPKEAAASPGRTKAKVEIYTTSWCPTCKKAKEFFASRKIPYTEFDIEKDASAAARHRGLSPQGYVPVVIVNGHQSVGLQPDEIMQALAGGN